MDETFPFESVNPFEGLKAGAEHSGIELEQTTRGSSALASVSGTHP